MENIPWNNVSVIPIDTIDVNKYQPRQVFDESSLEELATTINEYGLIQPITVRQTGFNSYELISGERRLRASKLAGNSDIRAIVYNMDDKDASIVAMIENIHREDLDFIEEAEGYYTILSKLNITQEELAKKVKKSQSTIANKLRILNLDTEIRNIIRDNRLSERHARALLSVKEEQRLEVLNKIISNNLNVKQTDQLVKRLKELDESKSKKKFKNMKKYIATSIYINTIKNAYSNIKEYLDDAEYSEEEEENCYKITIKIPKK